MNIHPQVKYLNQLPRVAQRSEEWFLSRKMRITASEICSVLGVNPYKSRNLFWREKLSILKNEPEKERVSSWISEWGVRYEPIVQNMIKEDHKERLKKKVFECFEAKQSKESNTTLLAEEEVKKNQMLMEIDSKSDEILFEYGMVCHPVIPFLGASPDGILYDGTMVEIKCPPTRKIEPFEVVPYYYSQMQLQMECCQLDRVDFVECKFYEYQNLESFKRDSFSQDNPLLSIEGKTKGVVILKDKEYLYFDAKLERQEKKKVSTLLYEWIEKHVPQMHKYNLSQKEKYSLPPPGATRLFFWRLDIFSTKIIRRNQEYINNMIQESTIFWQSLLDAKSVSRNPALVETNVDNRNEFLEKLPQTEEDADVCPLPRPKSFLFENFVFDDVLVIYKKKKDISENTMSSSSQPSNLKFSFQMK